MLGLKLFDQSLCLTLVYGPNVSAQYPEFRKETSDAVRKAETNESTIFVGDFNAHVGKDAGT